MSVASLYWIGSDSKTGRLAVAPRPRAGEWLEDEIKSWRSRGVDVVVCLLQDDELQELGLSAEASLCLKQGIEFVHFPIRDRAVPSNRPLTHKLIDKIGQHLADGQNVVIHCRAGIGRTGLIAACVLIKAGIDPDQALRTVSQARTIVVPDTAEQRNWVLDFAKN